MDEDPGAVTWTTPREARTALHQLVYCSTSRLEGDARQMSSSLNSILTSALKNNPAASLTGALVFNRDRFLQVLEGPRMSLIRIFNRILQDERHTKVMLIDLKPIDERSFGAWAMAYASNAAVFDFLDRGTTTSGLLIPAKVDLDGLITFIRQLIAVEPLVATSEPCRTSDDEN